MKFSCTKENIKQGLTTITHIAGKNINLPILSNVLIKATENNISLISTDLEIGVKTNIRGKVEKKGEFTVQAKLLADYISFLPNDKIDFDLIDNELKITCKNYKTKMKGENPEDYPVIPIIEKKYCFTINFDTFKKGLSEVIFAVANNETRVELSGVFFEFNNNELLLAATDSYRLAERKIKYENKNKTIESKKIIIPTKTLQEVLRFNFNDKVDNLTIKTKEADINIYISDNQVLFSYDDIEMVSRIIEGQYPDYKQIIPNSDHKKTTVNFDRYDLIRAVKASALFSKENINDINLDFPSGQKKVVVSSVNNKSGESIIEIDAQVDGEDNGIVLNYKYLLDGLAVLDVENITLEIINSTTPCLLKAQGRDDYLYIIMPIKQ